VVASAVGRGFPVLADPLSQSRSAGAIPGAVLGAYDAFLRSPALAERLKPDLILRIGRPPTSKALAGYLSRYKDVPQVLFAGEGEWPDPDLTAATVTSGDIEEYLRELETRAAGAADAGWLAAWQAAEMAALAAQQAVLDENGALSEPSVITDLADVVPDGYTVFAGNSMPVRDLESFWPVSEKTVSVAANRGASGIDGVLSTALGAAAACDGRLALVIGDLSFYHDMNGLLAAQRFGLKATIVLVNNDGGGIFSFLPQNDDQEHFEALFGTPHGLDFEPVARLYGLGWTRPATRTDYRAALAGSFESAGVQVIEVKTNRAANLNLHQRIWDEVARSVAPLAEAAVVAL
jgi:2-succinyl-5-enolpyruvyl-6-hydroxy-3-cyclohexene-1-carboxylate synthase